MKKTSLILLLCAACLGVYAQESESTALTNLCRAIALTDVTMETSFTGSTSDLRMYDTYDTSSKSGGGTADVWPYTAALEAHCSVLEALELLKDEAPELYAENHDRFVQRLGSLYDNLAFYRGTYTLKSYASIRSWKIFGVHRGARNNATVTGIENVYDDQMWLCRELTRAYRLTGEKRYLTEATNLADYCIDGWDCCLDVSGNEYGGISWGPGYNSKHSCSNGPFIQPLVWLADLYRSDDEAADMRLYYIDSDRVTRTNKLVRHSEVYLDFARKIYAWQKTKLLNKSTGVYYDMCGAVTGEIQYVTINRREYRDHVDINGPGGTAYTYNTGTMLAGAAELFRATGEAAYQTDLDDLCRSSYSQFAKGRRVDGVVYRDWPTDNVATSGFNTWFDDVLMRAYVDAYAFNKGNTYATQALGSFQQNLDYAWENHLRDGLLPIHLLDGWGEETVTKGFHQCAFASELAMLAAWQYRVAHPDGIQLPTYPVASSPSSRYYDLSGRTVGTPSRSGIYIKDGKKLAMKP